MTGRSQRDSPPVQTSLPLIGRERELQVLAGGIEDFLGRGRFVLIAGEAGMGKSRLSAWIADRARERGALVLWGWCWESVETPAYWPWRQVVRGLIDRLGTEIGELLGPSSAIVRMVPDAFEPIATDGEQETTRFDEFEALAAFVKKTSERVPLVLIFEDIHAADESSLLMLQFLARDITDARVLLVATRDPSANAPRDVEVTPSEIERGAQVVTLTGIDEGAIAPLYEAITGEKPTPAIVGAIHRGTEGNPLFVHEAVRMLTEKGDLHRPDHSVGFRVPVGVRDMMRRRVATLPKEDAAVLSIAAVIGREFDVSVLEKVSGLDQPVIFDALDRSVATGVIVEAGALGRYRFAHILIRETLYEDLSSSQRMRTHAQVARSLEEMFGFDLEPRFSELAHHWFKSAQAGDPLKALEYTVKAAEQASDHGAHEEAARLYQRALKVAELAQTPRESTNELEASLGKARTAAGTASPQAEPVTCRFNREGEFWTIVYQGTTTRLKDSRGLRLIARLLERPGTETHVLDLVGSGDVAVRKPVDELTSDGLSDLGPGLDATAKNAYKKRLFELQEEVEEAEGFNDPERASRAKEEMDALIDQLSGAVGLGGRDRKTGSAAERARVSVTKAIKEAIKRIAENDAGLGAHFTTAIRTGTFCSYMPDPRAAVEWELSR